MSRKAVWLRSVPRYDRGERLLRTAERFQCPVLEALGLDVSGLACAKRGEGILTRAGKAITTALDVPLLQFPYLGHEMHILASRTKRAVRPFPHRSVVRTIRAPEAWHKGHLTFQQGPRHLPRTRGNPRVGPVEAAPKATREAPTTVLMA